MTPDLVSNISLQQKCLSMINALAYHTIVLLTKVKLFVAWAPEIGREGERELAGNAI